MRRILVLAALVAVAAALPAQVGTNQLTTTYVSNNGQSGNMFDVDAVAPLSITDLAINADPGTFDVEVYIVTGGGSYIGNETNPAAWTRVDLFTGVTSAGTDVPTLLPPLSTPINIAPGTIQGIYVTLVNSTLINYTNGTTEGALFATDGVLNFYEGRGNAYPFGGNFVPRVWNGDIYYNLGAATPTWQVNQTESTLTFDGVTSSGFTSAVSSTTFCNPVTIDFQANGAPLAFDVGLTVGDPGVAGGVLTTGGGQILNINIASASFGWAFGGSFLTPYFPINLAAAFPAGFNLQAQAIVVDAAAAEGIAFSQFCDHTSTAAATFPALPLVDDGGQVIDLSASCATTSGGITWYGVNSSSVVAASNGRLLEGNTVDGDFSATIAEAQGDNAFVGFWTDLSPNAGGTWAISNPAPDVIELTYTNVGYFGQVAPASDNSYTIRYTDGPDTFELDGLQGILPSTTTMPAAFLGMSPGTLVGGATDPGAQAFAAGGAGAAGVPTDMLYEFTTGGSVAQPASIAGGLNNITFQPDGNGNYLWFGL